MKSRSLNLLQPQGPVQASIGVAFILLRAVRKYDLSLPQSEHVATDSALRFEQTCVIRQQGFPYSCCQGQSCSCQPKIVQLTIT